MNMPTISSRLKKAWNAFLNRDPTTEYRYYGSTYSVRPDRPSFSRKIDRTIVTAIINRIALDVASLEFTHCRLDEEGQYVSDMDSGLNNCLTLEANIDQSAREFIQDVVMSMFDEGEVAMVATDTTANPDITDSYDVLTVRTGKVLEWKPYHVKVRVYNERTGEKEDITVSKRSTVIIENPLYAVVNEPNSAMQQLKKTLSLIDVTDQQTASGKLDLIIQLPYVIKTDKRREIAENKRKDIEMQLSSSKYGVAYIDGTEKITQLNRPVENNLMSRVEYLTGMVFAQLGMTQSILDGTADEQTMLNYQNRTVEPIASAIAVGMKRKWLSKTARSQLQSIEVFRDPFKLVPLNQIADIADKFTRNEIASSNEIRQKIGMKPSKDPKADKLINSNISQPNAGEASNDTPTEDDQSSDKKPHESTEEFIARMLKK